MKKIRSILAVILVLGVCLSMCACSAITNLVSNTTYNTGDIEKGYSKVTTVDGVEFVVPSELKDEALGEMEFFALSMAAAADEEKAKELEKSTFEIRNSATYMLVNYSDTLIMVAPIDGNDLDDVESAEDFEDFLIDADDELSIVIGNSYVKSNLEGVVKVISPVEFTFGEDKNLSENYEYNGYVTAIENKDGDHYVMLAGSVEEDSETMKYLAKSLKYTGEELADPEEDDENSDIDFEIDEDDIKLGEGVELVPDNDDEKPTTDKEDEDKDDEKPSTTTKPSDSNISSDIKNAKLKDWTVQVKGTTIKFPMSYKEFLSKTGAEPAYDDEHKTELKPNTYDIVQLKIGDVKFSVDVVNNGESTINVTEGIMFGFGADRYELYGYGGEPTADNRFVLPGGIRVWGSTADDVKAAYGTPTEERKSDTFTYLKYDLAVQEYFDYSKMEIQIDNKTGLVYGFDYDNYNVD